MVDGIRYLHFNLIKLLGVCPENAKPDDPGRTKIFPLFVFKIVTQITHFEYFNL